ncbi:MAG TPA: hypothetical protein VKV16_00975, partial [Solirubrobacteraceae bacterium]|nr:hypothetical protein [Solirubrobacteraceae bacterium]
LARRPRALPGRLWRRHPLVSALTAAALLAYLAERAGLVPSSVRTLTGEYGLPHIESLSALFDRYRYYLSRITVGTGLLAIAVGLPWTLRALIRPRDGRRHALAVVCALGLLFMLLSLVAADPDERYVMYAAVPIALAFAAGVSGRLGLGVLLAAVLVDLLIESVVWPPVVNLYDYFTFPTAIFYQRILLGRLNLLHLPLSSERVVDILVLLVAVGAILATRRARLARPAAALLSVGVLAFCGVQTVYALDKYVTGAGGGPDAAERSWVDEHVPGGARVAATAISLGESPAYVPIWESTEYWNTSVEIDASFGAPGSLPFPPGSEPVHLQIQPGSGLLSALGGPLTDERVAPPEYVLVPLQGTNRIAFAGDVLAHSTYVPLELLRLSRPARVLWQLTGTSVEGFLGSGQSAGAIVYSGALAGHEHPCASFQLSGPPDYSGSHSYTVRSGGVVRSGALRSQQTQSVTVPLFPRATAHGSSAALSVTANGQASFFGLLASARLAFFSVVECPRSALAGR